MAMIFIFLPDVTVLSHFTVLVGKNFLLIFWILNLTDNETAVTVIVVNFSIEASFICLTNGEVMMATWSIHNKADHAEHIKFMTSFEI